MKKGVILIAVLALMACGSESNPTRPRTVVVKSEPAIELTFKNALKLEVSKKYRLRPRDTGAEYSEKIDGVSWGNVLNAELITRADFPEDAPKINVFFYFQRHPYRETVDGEPVIGYSDEIVVRVKGKIHIEKFTGGKRGEKFRYTHINCEAIAVENLSNPERRFLYH